MPKESAIERWNFGPAQTPGAGWRLTREETGEYVQYDDHLQALGEVEKERDQECEAATLWCQSSIAATVDLKAAEQKIQTITAGLEAEVDHLRERSRINRGIGGSEAAAEVAVAADRLQAILDQAETAGAG